MNKLIIFIFISCYCVPISSCAEQQQIDPYHFKTVKNIECKNGAVVSASAIASEVGISILKQGGNAVDAAIATQLALAVVHPGAGNIGGGGFTIIHLNNGQNIAIDYRETAPEKAYRDMYLDSNGNPQMNLSQNSPLASGVPGSVAGMFECMRYAKLPFKRLIQPAIDFAEKGFVLAPGEASGLNRIKNKLIKMNKRLPVFVKDIPWKTGDTSNSKRSCQHIKTYQRFWC